MEVVSQQCTIKQNRYWTIYVMPMLLALMISTKKMGLLLQIRGPGYYNLELLSCNGVARSHASARKQPLQTLATSCMGPMVPNLWEQELQQRHMLYDSNGTFILSTERELIEHFYSSIMGLLKFVVRGGINHNILCILASTINPFTLCIPINTQKHKRPEFVNFLVVRWCNVWCKILQIQVFFLDAKYKRLIIGRCKMYFHQYI